MSTREVQSPVHEVKCDRGGCTATYRSNDPWYARTAAHTRFKAGKAGWDVPPRRGKGSRRGTDFCPDHKNQTS